MLILASQSPRRREILANAGFRFEVKTAGVPEVPLPGEPAVDYVVRLSRSKAEAVSIGCSDMVLGADTVVVLGEDILEKPADAADARRMLRALSGREHRVLTGICLRYDGGLISDVAETTVRFNALSDAEIQEYVRSGEPMDKAGAYAIQGLGSKFIERIDGCYFNVVGLPISLVYRYLKELGVADQILAAG